ncbi:MAG: preprotein translocase subunit SecE [Patescibacteria group bacterium]|jgi:preprotein translocase SecE subunit
MANLSTISQYVKDSWKELHHVSWPTKSEIKKHTILVIAISLGLALFLGACDYVITLGLDKILIK